MISGGIAGNLPHLRFRTVALGGDLNWADWRTVLCGEHPSWNRRSTPHTFLERPATLRIAITSVGVTTSRNPLSAAPCKIRWVLRRAETERTVGYRPKGCRGCRGPILFPPVALSQSSPDTIP
jgi:hypothetical protein